MKTGIVVDNYDPLYKGRCKIRVFGLHSENICGEYLILDDDLPWACPAPNVGSSNGSFNVPNIGERIYAKVIEPDIENNRLKLSIKGLNYKEFYENRKVKESVRGFSPLQENLEKWMDYTLKEMEH